MKRMRPKEFIPGVSPVPVSGRVFDAADIQTLVESSLDFWLTTGRFANQFEREFARFCGVRKALLVNSGSSADLVALTTLTSPTLGEKRLKPGDEVITVAAGFPTTVNPIIQNGLVPVFLDVTIPDYNLDIRQLEEALSPKTRALMFAHTLGNPGNMTAISEFVKKHNLVSGGRLLRRHRGNVQRPESRHVRRHRHRLVSIPRTISRWARAARSL